MDKPGSRALLSEKEAKDADKASAAQLMPKLLPFDGDIEAVAVNGKGPLRGLPDIHLDADSGDLPPVLEPAKNPEPGGFPGVRNSDLELLRQLPKERINSHMKGLIKRPHHREALLGDGLLNGVGSRESLNNNKKSLNLLSNERNSIRSPIYPKNSEARRRSSASSRVSPPILGREDHVSASTETEWNISCPFTMSNPNSDSTACFAERPTSLLAKSISRSLNGDHKYNNNNNNYHNIKFDTSSSKVKTEKKVKPKDNMSIGFGGEVTHSSAKYGVAAVTLSPIVMSEEPAPQPEVEIVDGVDFMSWETKHEMEEFTRIQGNKKQRLLEAKSNRSRDSLKIIAPTKTKDITKIKGWRDKVFATSPLHESNPPPPATPPPPRLIKRPDLSKSDITYSSSKVNTVPSNSTPKSSAFVSDLLDDYLSKTKDEVKFRNLESDLDVGSPPEDSPIYSHGVLKMPVNLKRNSSDLPKLSGPISWSQASQEPTSFASPAKRKRGRPKLSDQFLTHKQMPEYQVKQKRGPKKRKSVPVTLEDLEMIVDPTVSVSAKRLESCFDNLMEETYADIQSRKKEYSASFIMDEPYLRYALGTLNVPKIEPLSPRKGRSPKKSAPDILNAVGLTAAVFADAGGEDYVPPQSSRLASTSSGKGLAKERDANIAKLISRHSKRDIRLPARYHQSGLLMGSQWITPNFEVSEKKGKKRLVEEQKRLQLVQKKKRSRGEGGVKEEEDCDQFDQLEELHLEHQLPTKKPQRSEAAGSSYLLQRKKRIKAMHGTTSYLHLKLHNKRIEQIKQQKLELQERRKMLQEECDADTREMEKVEREKVNLMASANVVKSTKGINNGSPPVASLVGFKSLHELALAPSSPLSSTVSAGQTSNIPNAGGDKKKELRELYRLLFYENKPDRRYHFSRKGTKPRVNKKQVVEEGIQVIQKLLKREKQLQYIKKLLGMWQNKLALCIKVSEKGMTPQVLNVVQEVLKAFQSSVCYKVSEALEIKRRELAAGLQQQPTPQGVKSAATVSSAPATAPTAKVASLSTPASTVTGEGSLVVMKPNRTYSIFKPRGRPVPVLPKPPALVGNSISVVGPNVYTMKNPPQVTFANSQLVPLIRTWAPIKSQSGQLPAKNTTIAGRFQAPVSIRPGSSADVASTSSAAPKLPLWVGVVGQKTGSQRIVKAAPGAIVPMSALVSSSSPTTPTYTSFTFSPASSSFSLLAKNGPKPEPSKQSAPEAQLAAIGTTKPVIVTPSFITYSGNLKTTIVTVKCLELNRGEQRECSS